MNQTPQNYGEAQAHLKKTLQVEWNRLRSQNPHLAGMELKAETLIYKKRPAGYYKVYLDIMERLLWRGYADKTQQAILSEIKPLHPHQNIMPNIWQKKLTKTQMDAMNTKVKTSGNNTQNIDLAGCRTLADIKGRIRMHLHSAEAVQTFKGKIAINSTTVVIGRDTHLIHNKPTGKYQYPSIRVAVGKKRPWVRVDVLAALLAN